MTGSIALPLHADLRGLAPLVGRWRGVGHGAYPSIDSFDYREEVAFAHTGKPFLSYVQRTWLQPGGEPSHAEAGYLRARPGGHAVELVLAQPSGVVELHEGTIRDGHLELATTLVARTATAKEVSKVRRVLDVDGDTIRYRVEMAAVGHELCGHLEGELRRQ